MGEDRLLLSIHQPYSGLLDIGIEAILGEDRHVADQTGQIGLSE